MALNTLRDVYEETIKDLYSAEGQIAKALPKMAKGASSPELKKAFEQHLEVTRKQIERLVQVCKDAGISPGGKKCAGMEGLLKEGEEVLKEKGNGPSRDAALIAAAQKVEHYEISGYGSARTFAERLGFTKSAKLLDKTLEEESKTDEKLTTIAERNVNRASEEDAKAAGETAGAKAKKPAGKTAAGAKSSAKASATGTKTAGGRTTAKKAATGTKSSASGSTRSASSSAKSSAAGKAGGASKSSSAASRSTAAKSRSSAAGKSAGKQSKGRSTKSATGKGSAHPTTDHDFIRRWVEERGGSPACVKGTGNEGDIGMLRIDFPGYSGEDSLQHIEWDEFFDKFEEKNLAFLHQDSRAGGGETRFFKLVSRDSVEED